MEELIAYRADLLSALETSVDEISRRASQLPSHSLNLQISSDGHTAHYALYQLYALEAQFFAVQLPRMRIEETAGLPVFDADQWMASHYHPEEPVDNIIGEVTKLRQHELGWLRYLSSQEWSYTARHPWWGVHTLQWWVELQLDYSLEVLKQLTAA